MHETLPVVLVTGSSGMVAGFVLPALAADHELRLLDVRAPGDRVPGLPETVIGSVGDTAVLDAVMPGVDTVVHLGGIPKEASFDDVLEVNVRGTHEVLRAAVRHGVRRVVIASSNHAAGFHERPTAGEALAPDAEARPDTFYGWSKAATETLGRLYSDRFGLEVVVVRIAQCARRPQHDDRGRALWLSPDDAARLFVAAVDDRTPGYQQLWGVSANSAAELSTANDLGYQPHDDADDALAGVPLVAPPNGLLGGLFCEVPLGERRP